MQNVATDIFATKGVEYLIVIGYLLVLIGFWQLLSRPGAPAAAKRVRLPDLGWLQLREGYHFHQGHSWALAEAGDVVRVGADAFAMRLLGRIGAVALPEVGSQLRQGERGWEFGVQDKAISMLSPVDGQVTEINPEVLQSPDLASVDPYDRGWLLKVRVPNSRTSLKNLLTGKLARAWITGVVDGLQAPAGGLGVVMADGGMPVDGFARALSPDAWDDLARELLLSD